MNDQKIEELLRRTPRLVPPDGLLEELKREIPTMRAQVILPRRRETASFFRRWFPAISFAAFFLICAAVLGVQTNALLQLKKENEALRAATQNLEQLRREAEEYRKVSLAGQQLEQLRKDNLELQKLRAEAVQLRVQLQEMESLRAEKQRLLAENAARQAHGGAASDEDFFKAAKENTESIQCIRNLKNIGVAARMWANDNRNILPRDFASMSTELPSPKVLACPGSGEAYVILSPGVSGTEYQVVFAQCPTHGHVVLVEGSAHMLSSDGRKVILKNGKYIIGRTSE